MKTVADLTVVHSCVMCVEIQFEKKRDALCSPGGAGVVVAGDDVAAGPGAGVTELEVDPLPGGAQGAMGAHHLWVS